jgi:cell volume regulation protein A
LESAPLDEMSAVVLGVDVSAASLIVGVYINEMGLPDGAVVSLIIRDAQTIVPTLDSRIRIGDQLIVVAAADVQGETERRLKELSEGGRLADWYRKPDRHDHN